MQYQILVSNIREKNVENIYNGKFEYPDRWNSVSDIQVVLSTS